ncbi:helix-turn-helix domain-containing protein [Donghicola sp. XS_ASV15]|uniref:helix-turn-helix domain-containing protein n=1 Tax=Donghicola sp. XS_ASV15 TaxID=3241295 RepID=UPI003519B559
MRGDVFKVLQEALRARRMTYADLADTMGLSEPTIKRIFAARDCKLSRIIEICDALELSLSDVTDNAARQQAEATVLPMATELSLAADPPLFYFLILLRDLRAPEYIAQVMGLSPTRLHQMGMTLERLGLAEVGAGNKFRLLSHAPIRFRPNGPLLALLRDINLRFIAKGITAPTTPADHFFTVSRRMRVESAVEIRRDLNALTEKIAELARLDQLVAREDQLQPFKISGFWGRVDFAGLMKQASETDSSTDVLETNERHR